MFCKIQSLNLFYEDIGTGEPIIILHGFTLDHYSMTESLEPIFELLEGWRRLYIDLPGHGRTKGVDWIKSSDDMLKVVLDFIDTIIPEKRFSIIGLSYGGYLARGIVYHRSAMIDGVLLIVPRIVSHPKERKLPSRAIFEKDESFLSTLNSAERSGFEEVAVLQTEKIWKRFEKEIVSAILIADDVFLKRLDNTVDSFSFIVDSPPSKFEKPSLFLLGRQDHWVGYQDALDIMENYPRSTFAVLDKAGHGLQMEQEHLFNAMVKEWLHRVRNEM